MSTSLATSPALPAYLADLLSLEVLSKEQALALERSGAYQCGGGYVGGIGDTVATLEPRSGSGPSWRTRTLITWHKLPM